jgi:hypothetical protein
MWKKTIMHELRKWLQKSTEYLPGQLAARAALAAYGPASPAEDPERRIGPAPVPGLPPAATRAIGNGNTTPPQQTSQRAPAGSRRAGVAEQSAQREPSQRDRDMAAIVAAFDRLQASAAQREDYSVAILGDDTEAVRGGNLTAAQAAELARTLAGIADGAGFGGDTDPGEAGRTAAVAVLDGLVSASGSAPAGDPGGGE